MSLVLYYAPMSTATISQLVLEELGVPCERVKVDIQKGETKKAEFLKLNPNGRVPLLVHDGTCIWESSAITMYLGETFGVHKGLYPSAGPKRGEAMKWITWANVTLGEAVSRFMRNTGTFTPGDQQNPKAGEVAKADVLDHLKVLDGALAGGSFLVGDYSLADTHVNSFTDWLRHMKVDLTPFTHLNAWSQRCSARPAYAKVMASAGS